MFSVLSVQNSSRFWTVEQRSHLFPAEISDDSPWKQETAISILDQDTENKTQEAIEHYFSQNHDVKSPEDPPISNAKSFLPNSSIIDTASPVLLSSLSRRSSTAGSNMSSSEPPAKVSQWTQTELTLPAVLPPEVEKVLKQYMR